MVKISNTIIAVIMGILRMSVIVINLKKSMMVIRKIIIIIIKELVQIITIAKMLAVMATT